MHSWRTKLIFSSKEKVAVCKVGDLSAITPKLLQLEAARGGPGSGGLVGGGGPGGYCSVEGCKEELDCKYQDGV